MTFAMRYGFILFVAVVALLAANSVVALSSRPPRNNDVSNMDNVENYLEDLDYLAERTRARFGKRNILAQLYRNRLADNADMVGSRDAGGWARIHILPMPLKPRLMPFSQLNKSRAGELSTADEPF